MKNVLNVNDEGMKVKSLHRTHLENFSLDYCVYCYIAIFHALFFEVLKHNNMKCTFLQLKLLSNGNFFYCYNILIASKQISFLVSSYFVFYHHQMSIFARGCGKLLMLLQDDMMIWWYDDMMISCYCCYFHTGLILIFFGYWFWNI